MFKNRVYKNTINFFFALAVVVTGLAVIARTEVADYLIPEYQSVAFWATMIILVFALIATLGAFREGYRQDRERQNVRILRAHLDRNDVNAEVKLAELFTGNIGLNPKSMVARFVRRVGYSKLTNDAYRIDVESFADDLEIELDRPSSRIGKAATYMTRMGLFGTFFGLLSMQGLDWAILSQGDLAATVGLLGGILAALATAFQTTIYGLFFNMYISKMHDKLDENVVELTNEVTILFRTRVAPIVNDQERVKTVMQAWKEAKPDDFEKVETQEIQ